MPTKKKPQGINRHDAQHRKNLSRYERQIDEIHKWAIREAVSIASTITHISHDEIFSFDKYPITKQRLDKLLSSMQREMEAVVVNGIRAEWELSNAKNDEVAKRVIGKRWIGKAGGVHVVRNSRRYFNRNEEALNAFLTRVEGGMNLSERVWKYTEQFREEIELGLDLGIREGRSAEALSQDLRKALKHPDKLFRRVRDKHGQLALSKRAKAYHPGRGVYRSSYKNARRLAATETNIAYRTADYLRWQQMDFVVGVEVSLSNNHTLNGHPFEDICDYLAGKYPKDFKFSGWHPHCRCVATSILKTEEELEEDTRRILEGEAVTTESKNRVDDTPERFKAWMEENGERIENAKSLPYFIKDNPKYTR